MPKPTQALLFKIFDQEVRKGEQIGDPVDGDSSYYESWAELDKITEPVEQKKGEWVVVFEYKYLRETVAGGSLGYYHCDSKELRVVVSDDGIVIGKPEMKSGGKYSRMFEEEVSPLLVVR